MGNISTDVAVIGAGPAGLACGAVVAAAGNETVLIESSTLGGELLNVEVVHDFPGHDEKVPGYELAGRLLERADQAGAHMELVDVEGVTRTPDGWEVHAGATTLEAHAVVIATGSKPHLPEPMTAARRFEGRGLSFCALCDGPMFHGMSVAVVGDDDIALAETGTLAGHTERVILLAPGGLEHVSTGWRADVLGLDNVVVHRRARVIAVDGDERVRAVRFVCEGAENTVDVSGVFVAAGREPSIPFIDDTIPRDDHGALVVDPALAAPLPDLMAIGDVRSGSAFSVVGAIADGVAAGRALVRRDRTPAPRPQR